MSSADKLKSTPFRNAHFMNVVVNGRSKIGVNVAPCRTAGGSLSITGRPFIAFYIIVRRYGFLQGYFQLKATAGSFQLRLRPGRSGDIYTIAR